MEQAASCGWRVLCASAAWRIHRRAVSYRSSCSSSSCRLPLWLRYVCGDVPYVIINVVQLHLSGKPEQMLRIKCKLMLSHLRRGGVKAAIDMASR
ncbi:hypothetical protein ACLKA6_015389 [Drosophila palustris]